MKKETYVCDICEAERKDANHWFTAIITETGLDSHSHILGFTAWEAVGELAQAVKDAIDVEAKQFTVCGQVCAHKLLDQFLSGELK